ARPWGEADPRRRRVGALLLHRLPQPPARLSQGVGRSPHQLGICGRAVRPQVTARPAPSSALPEGAFQSVRFSVFCWQTSTSDASIDWPSAKVPCRLTRQLNGRGKLASACLPALSEPSTLFQLT